MNSTLSINDIAFLSTDLHISKTPFYKHKEAELILEKAKTTSGLLGIVDETLYRDHTTMTNYLYVNGSIQKMVNVLVTYDTLYFLDDFFGEDTVKEDVADLKTILALWEGKTIEITVKNDKLKKLYQAIKYIGEVIREDSSIHFFKKYTASVKEHLYYALESPSYKTVNEYIKIRLYTSGMMPVIDLIEYVNDNYIPERIESKLPLLQKLKQTCALIGGLSNDLFSYAKEKHSDFNLINAFLLTKEANTYEEAVSKSIILVNKLSEDFEQDLKHIRNEIQALDYMDKSIIENHLKGLEVIVSACYHWQFETKRYRHSEAVFEDIKLN
jgi:hypothetical protein